MGRREQARQDKERRIREAALTLFLEKGYEQTTTKEIAEAADVATGTLFLYVQDKPELLALIFQERISAAVDKAFARLPGHRPLIDQLLHVFGALFDVYRPMPDLAREFVKAQFFVRGGKMFDESTRFRDSFQARMIPLFEAEQAAGRLGTDYPAPFVARMAFSLYFNALSAWLHGAADFKTARTSLLRSFLEIQMRGLAPVRKGNPS